MKGDETTSETMDALKQSLKIGVGLAAMVAVCVALLPERPSLFAGEAAAERASAATAEPSDADSADLLLATAGAVPEEAEPETVELAQAAPSAVGGSGAGEAQDGLTEGQRHLQRLRERSQGTPPAAPEASPPAAPRPAPSPAEPAPQATARPAPSAPSAPQAGGQGLDSLTRPAAPPEFRLFQNAEAVDSATIRARGETVRLSGIVPVGADERCADGSACGAQARAAVDEWLSGQEVVCAVSPGADAAPCVRGEEDIAEWAVENGWASAEPGSVYEAAETRARDAGLGIWASGGR